MMGKEQITTVINKLELVFGIVNKNFDLEYLNPQLEEFLNTSLKDTNPVIPLKGFLSKTEWDKFVKFYKDTKNRNDKRQWRYFDFKNDACAKKRLLVGFDHHTLNSENSSPVLILGIPVDEFEYDKKLYNIIQNNVREQLKTNKYRDIFDNAIIGIAIFDEDGRVEEINKAFLEQLGFEKEEIIDKQIEDIFSGELLNKVQTLLEMIKRNKHNLAKNVVSFGNKENGYRLFEISLSKLTNSEVFLDKTMMISEDVTEQADTHAALIQSEKLALTGRLAASLAHEINNPLQTSIGCLGLADEILNDHERKDDLGVYISLALDEMKRSARIVKKLRDLSSRKDVSEKSYVNLKEVVESVFTLTRKQLEDKNIIPTFQFDGEEPIIIASKDQLKQVLLNLVINAIDAMPEGGKVSIVLNHTEKPDGIKILVHDTGHGVSNEVIKQLFDPFFTTKDDGLGLGLFICKEIIEDHHGNLMINSQVGRGTTFTLWLPKTQNKE